MDFRLELKNLIVQRDDIDREIAEASLVLQTNRTDLTQSLVDSEGFPRSDIDVHAIRTARHKIICLHNDRKALMRVIEEKMFALHSDQSNESEQMRRLKISLPGQSEIEEIGPVVIAAADRQTFVKVGDVTQQSPAAESGLQKNDQIIQFGSVSKTNYQNLQQLCSIVSDSFNKPIVVVVQRGLQTLEIIVTPKKWSGQGTLGCRLLPL